MTEVTTTKRAQTRLKLSCRVCSAPAPDHFHFGGKTIPVEKEWSRYIYSFIAANCCYSCRAFFRGAQWHSTVTDNQLDALVPENVETGWTRISCRFWLFHDFFKSFIVRPSQFFILLVKFFLCDMLRCFQENYTAGSFERFKAMQDWKEGLLRITVDQELYSLSLQQMSQHRNESQPTPGSETQTEFYWGKQW